MSKARRLFLDYVGIVVGSAIVALALDWFLVPNRIAAGGVSGLATLTHYIFGWPVGMTMLGVNLPLFLVSLKVLGVRFGVKTVVGTVATSVLVDTFAPLLQPLDARSGAGADLRRRPRGVRHRDHLSLRRLDRRHRHGGPLAQSLHDDQRGQVAIDL